MWFVLSESAAALCQRHGHRSRGSSAHAAGAAWSRAGAAVVHGSRRTRCSYPAPLLSSKKLTRVSICCFEGHGKKGTQSLILALRTLNGMATS
jgi:hypothetical protein